MIHGYNTLARGGQNELHVRYCPLWLGMLTYTARLFSLYEKVPHVERGPLSIIQTQVPLLLTNVGLAYHQMSPQGRDLGRAREILSALAWDAHTNCTVLSFIVKGP